MSENEKKKEPTYSEMVKRKYEIQDRYNVNVRTSSSRSEFTTELIETLRAQGATDKALLQRGFTVQQIVAADRKKGRGF